MTHALCPLGDFPTFDFSVPDCEPSSHAADEDCGLGKATGTPSLTLPAASFGLWDVSDSSRRVSDGERRKKGRTMDNGSRRNLHNHLMAPLSVLSSFTTFVTNATTVL
jgi:hypothetical protein